MTDSSRKNTNKNYQEKDLSNFPPQDGKPRKKSEKKVLVFLVILVIVALPLSIWQINRQLKSPFAPKKAEQTSSSNQLSSATNTETPRIESLRTSDTDQDGISDYDELYVYKTSPYIADSDSDKIDDKMEIEQGTDPNCPAGVVCSREPSEEMSNTNTTSGEESSDTDVTNLSADQLREVMRDAGASEQQLNQISDDELLQAYQEILETEGVDLGLDLNVNSTTTNTTDSDQPFSYETLDYETLFSLEPAGIRQLLIEGGVPKETLDEIDDETLLQIYQESLSQNLNDLVESTQ